MKSPILLTLCCLVAVVSAPAFAEEEFLLYAPKPAAGDQVPASPDQGVLVKKLTVKRGDTLRGISRKHLGAPSWFPQVLLFNSIKNPDLIHTGDKLLVPVRPGHPAPQPKSHKKKKLHSARRTSSPHGTSAAEPVRAETGSVESYQQARSAYLRGDYKKSLELFDAFLRSYPRSDLAADAALYRADSLLRLSGQ